MRRQEMPASTSRRALSQHTKTALPEDPLANVCTVVKQDTSLSVVVKTGKKKLASAQENAD